jgi:hypothetical protein
MRTASTKHASQVGAPREDDARRENSKLFAEWAARLDRKLRKQRRKRRARAASGHGGSR